MEATLNGLKLANTDVTGDGVESTEGGYVTLNGAVLTCDLCGAPITLTTLKEQAITLADVLSFDSINCAYHHQYAINGEWYGQTVAPLPEIGATVAAYGEKFTVIRYEKAGSDIIAIGRNERGREFGVDHRPADSEELSLPDGECEYRK